MNKRQPIEEPTEVQPMLLTIPQVATLLSVRRSKVYTLIQEGLPTVSLGKRGDRRVNRTSLEQWIKLQENRAG